MTTLVVMGALVLFSAPFEAIKHPRKVKVYRKPDTPKGHKKARSPSTATDFNAITQRIARA